LDRTNPQVGVRTLTPFPKKKITVDEMREMGVRDVLIYCRIIACRWSCRLLVALEERPA
jgi:hypothetical protein